MCIVDVAFTLKNAIRDDSAGIDHHGFVIVVTLRMQPVLFPVAQLPWAVIFQRADRECDAVVCSDRVQQQQVTRFNVIAYLIIPLN